MEIGLDCYCQKEASAEVALMKWMMGGAGTGLQTEELMV